MLERIQSFKYCEEKRNPQKKKLLGVFGGEPTVLGVGARSK